ncbi:MAG: hypothetical protein RIR51_185 [Bacteroidota bacterium]|jgi:hypothetical protein
MKKLFLLFILTFSFTTFLNAQAVVKFKEEKFNFGKIKEGVVATHSFEFTNSGNAPVIISNVAPSCGCTTPSWTKEPIMPGKTGKITASYNSEGRPGAFNKSITVTSNAQNGQLVLFINGEVIK